MGSEAIRHRCFEADCCLHLHPLDDSRTGMLDVGESISLTREGNKKRDRGKKEVKDRQSRR